MTLVTGWVLDDKLTDHVLSLSIWAVRIQYSSLKHMF